VDDLVFPNKADFDVACHTEGCENIGIVIRVSAIADTPYIVCGPCGIQIEDVTPVGS